MESALIELLNLQGKVAIVTGGAQGIGQGVYDLVIIFARAKTASTRDHGLGGRQFRALGLGQFLTDKHGLWRCRLGGDVLDRAEVHDRAPDPPARGGSSPSRRRPARPGRASFSSPQRSRPAGEAFHLQPPHTATSSGGSSSVISSGPAMSRMRVC